MPAWDFSPSPRKSSGISIDATKRDLLSRVEQVCAYLLPGGKKIGGRWECADIGGSRGHSLKVELGGDKVGVWSDFATGDAGDILDLWAKARGGIEMSVAKEEAEKWLGKVAPVAEKTNNWTKSKPKIDLPAPDREWTYYTADGDVFCYVHRIDRPGQRKIVKPVLPDRSDYGKPKDRPAPLLNLPEIIKRPGATVLLVEGEKCVDATTNMVADVIPTTMIGGSAAAAQTDWSSLRGRHVVRWPDHDKAGTAWMASTLSALKSAGVASVRDVVPNVDWPEGEDAADRSDGERRFFIKQALASDPVYVGAVLKDLEDEVFGEFADTEATPTEWLVDGLFQRGRGGIFAAAGGTGKGFLLLDMAIKVGSEPYAGFDASPETILGHEVKRHGRVVFLSGEDDRSELHRRIKTLCPNMPESVRKRVHYRAYPSRPDQTPHLFVEHRDNSLRPTDEFKYLMDRMSKWKDLELLVIDPLQAFFAADITTNVMAQMVANIIDKMAIELGCTVVAAHHMTKGDRNKPVRTASDARNSIQGAAQLMSAVRWAYAIWPEEDVAARTIAQDLGIPPEEYHESLVYRGAIVKTNTNTSTEVATFVRNRQSGLLEYVSSARRNEAFAEEKKAPLDKQAMVRHAVKFFCDAGYPPTIADLTGTASSKNSGYVTLMPDEWKKYTVKRRHSIVSSMIDDGVFKTFESNKHQILILSDDDRWSDLTMVEQERKRGGTVPPVPWPPQQEEEEQ
jgi:hypothetical protein